MKLINNSGSNNCKNCNVKYSYICSIFKSHELDLLDQFIEKFSIQKKEYLFKEGDKAEYLYIISSGGFKKYKTIEDGRRQILSFPLTNSVIGATNNNKHKFSAQALTDSTVCRIKVNSIELLANQNHKLYESIITSLSLELEKIQDHLFILGRYNAIEKIAHFLLGIYDNSESEDHIYTPIKRSDIADYTGLTIESVSRTFAQLKKIGAIDVIDRNNTKILDINILRNSIPSALN